MTNISKINKMNTLNYRLENLLMGYTKVQQMEVADSLNRSVPKSWAKSKVAKELAFTIQEQAETVYQEVLEEFIKQLPSQEQSVYIVETQESISSLNPLIEKGFLYVQQANESYALIIPEEILAAAMSDEELTRAINQPQSDAAAIINKWKESLLAIYGTVSVRHLHTVWNRHYLEKLSMEEISELLSN